MSIDIIRLLIGFGLFVLIWMVQLIVYPSFMYYETHNLIKWHKQYVFNFKFIVIHLMLVQLGISLYQAIIFSNLYTITSLILILLVWITTFFQFVPIHSNISKGIVNKKMLNTLVNKNWIRTFLWSLEFIISCAYYF